jgi:hypothetical protein
MNNPENIERRNNGNKLPFRKNAGLYISRLGLVAMCMLPMADLACSDAFGAWVLNQVQTTVKLEPEPLQRTAQMSLVAGEIMAESMLLGYAISRPKRLQNVFGGFDEYLAERQKKMRLPHKIVSKLAHLPYKGLEKIGQGVEKIGERIDRFENPLSRKIGKTALDEGMILAEGTGNIIMQETMAGKSLTLGRNTKLAALVTATWVGAAELVRFAYHHAGPLKPAMAKAGETFVNLTSIDFMNPLHTSPAAALALGTIATGLAISGWNMSKFYEQNLQTGIMPEQSNPVDQ